MSAQSGPKTRTSLRLNILLLIRTTRPCTASLYIYSAMSVLATKSENPSVPSFHSSYLAVYPFTYSQQNIATFGSQFWLESSCPCSLLLLEEKWLRLFNKKRIRIYSLEVDTTAVTNHDSYPVNIPPLAEMGASSKEQQNDLEVFCCVKAKITNCFACLCGLCSTIQMSSMTGKN